MNEVMGGAADERRHEGRGRSLVDFEWRADLLDAARYS